MTKKEIWVKLKRLFEPDTDDELWKLQKHIHDLTWRIYDSCGVHHVSTEKGIDIYMLVEKEYPLSRGTLTLMLVQDLVVQAKEMVKELIGRYSCSTAKPTVSTAQVTTASTNQLVLLDVYLIKLEDLQLSIRIIKDL
ncbi:hypothetical protein Tco_1515140 [Tanacetum coccineum]